MEVEKLTGNNKLHCAILRNDIDASFKEIENININDVNLRGETPLHLAAKNKTPNSVLFIEILISANANINARNKWGQTPLHYAATIKSFENVECLLEAPSVDVNSADVNGYNALHTYISSHDSGALEDITNHWDSMDSLENVLSSDVQKFISILVNKGTNINEQTKFGQSILHLVSTRNDNTPFIRHILQNFPAMNLTIRNKMGENFLHVYVGCEIFEEIIDTFEIIAEKCLTTLQDLLNRRNVFGRTPWSIMIDNVNISTEALVKILTYGISTKSVDNLGNSALHCISGVSSGIVFCDILEVLIKNGVGVNNKNVYGESAASVLFLEGVLDTLCKYKIDLNLSDRWGRSVLVSIMKHRPIPSLIRKLIEEGKVNINTKDIYGSTPLHFATYHDYPEQVEMLTEYGADKDVTDNLHDRPLDTCRRHISFQCYQILLKATDNNEQILYTRHRTFEDILLEMPKMITSSSMESAQDVQKILGLPKNLDGFTDDLIRSYFERMPEDAREVEDIIHKVNALVKTLCKLISKYDSRFEMSVFPTGSTAEGTKVGCPDEFDFVLCLDRLTEISEIVMTIDCLETGYACLKFTESPVREEYLPFSDVEGYFLPFPFLQYFFRYLRRALNENQVWKSGNFCFNFEDKIEVVRGKPVFSFCVYWIGSVYKQLKISIDLVPAIYKRGWWPPNINIREIPLMNENIEAAGCLLILQTMSNEFDNKRHTMDDSISYTCNAIRDDTNLSKIRMMRISAVPAEICLMQSMPEKFRQSYALAKILRSKQVCPEIKIDRVESIRYTIQRKFDESKSNFPVKPSKQIKSYMLKNCTFYTLQDMQSVNDQDMKVSHIAVKLYQLLLKSSDEHHMTPYFLPFTDVFDMEKDTTRSSYNHYMLHLRRELSIKLILGILNHSFPRKQGKGY